MTDLELQSQETEALLKTSERPKKRALAIQIIALCGGAALAGAALASRAGPHDLTVTGLARKGTDNRHVACPQMWEPVYGEWPCAAPQTPEPTAAPTPHHHHHDGAVAEFRDAALGSLVVAALTAAVLI